MSATQTRHEDEKLNSINLRHRACKTALMNVRFERNNGHDADVTRCLLLTQSGHEGENEKAAGEAFKLSEACDR